MSINYGLLGIKYTFRTLHMISFGFLFGHMSFDLFFGKRSIEESQLKTFKTFNMIFSIILIVSGLINMILLIKDKPYRRDNATRIWKYILYFKLFLSILLTPLLGTVVGWFTGPDNEKTLIGLRFAIVLIAVLLSPFARYFRETFFKVDEYNKSHHN